MQVSTFHTEATAVGLLA